MIDRLIRDQVKLFPNFPHNDDGLREVITQVVTGKPGQRMAKLYQCLVESFIMVTCPVPHLDMKKGVLNQMAFSLFFFLRDVCRGDFYRFVQNQFGDRPLPERELGERIQGFIDQVSRIKNVGPKLVDMVFSHIFFTQAPGWDYRAIGVRMVAIDTLVHNFLAKTGTFCEGAGVKYFRYHALRHSGASIMDLKNVPIGVIQRILGHENRETTEIYLHTIGQPERQAMETYEKAT
jgi:hypothetical protein